MAGAGYKLFNTGDVLTAAQVNTYLMEQTVMVFADAAARTTALSGVVSEGMISYLKDTNAVEVYNGSSWVASDDPNAIQNTIVDAKGDLITATAADTPARLAVGSNGDTLVADSAATTGLRWQGNYAAGKNKIINGDMRINQRNFSSGTTDGSYIFDRFWFSASDGTTTGSVQTFTPGTAPVSGYEAINFARLVTTGQTLSTAQSTLRQSIEDVRTLAGQTATISFWAKSGSGTPNISVEVQQNFGSGGSSAVNTQIGSKTAISTTWTRYSFTATIPSISGKTIGSSSFAQLIIWVSAGSNFDARTGTLGIQSNTFDIWGVQVEAGNVSTSFQTATGTIQGEKAACERYYEKSYDIGTAPGTATSVGSVMGGFNMPAAAASTTGYILSGVRWRTEKRATPTVTVYDIAGTSGVVTASNPGTGNTNGNALYTSDIGTTGAIIGRDGVGGTRTAVNGFFYQYVASAEL